MKKHISLLSLVLLLAICLSLALSACGQTENATLPSASESSSVDDILTEEPSASVSLEPTEASSAPSEEPSENTSSDPTDEPTENPTDEPEPIPAEYVWELADLGACVGIHTDAQKQYLSGSYMDIEEYAAGDAELSRPLPIVLFWTATPVGEAEPAVTEYKVEVSEKSNFSNALTFVTAESSIDVYNLYLGKLYYWRVTAVLEDGQTVISETKAFATLGDAPRNLYVDGVTNVRDLGGWKTADGKTVKQGMIYRSGRLNTSESETLAIEITESGIAMMRDTLGIKTEIDLRRVDNNEIGALTSSPLGEGVSYVSAPMDWSVDNMILDNIDEIKHVFSVLADEDNYPIVYHCNIGTDRTGMFAFLIHALLGVSEEDLYRDYLFSNFGLIGGTRGYLNLRRTHLRTVEKYEGETLSEKTRNCLVTLGVPAEHLDAVVRIMSAD